MSRLTRDGTAEPVSRDQVLGRERGQGNIQFPYLADHEQDWQPHPDDPYSAIRDDDIYHCTTTTVLFSPYIVLRSIILLIALQPVAPVAQRYLVTL